MVDTHVSFFLFLPPVTPLIGKNKLLHSFQWHYIPGFYYIFFYTTVYLPGPLNTSLTCQFMNELFG